jgi:hypothetical protein
MVNILTIKDSAEDLVNSDFSVIPVNENKTPAITSWKQYQSSIMDPSLVPNILKNLGELP